MILLMILQSSVDELECSGHGRNPDEARKVSGAKFNSWLYESARSALENESFPEIFCPGHLAFLTLVPALVDGTRREGICRDLPAGGEEVSFPLYTDLENIKIIVWSLLEWGLCFRAIHDDRGDSGRRCC